jgi:hypothetical protein
MNPYGGQVFSLLVKPFGILRFASGGRRLRDGGIEADKPEPQGCREAGGQDLRRDPLSSGRDMPIGLTDKLMI